MELTRAHLSRPWGNKVTHIWYATTYVTTYVTTWACYNICYNMDRVTICYNICYNMDHVTTYVTTYVTTWIMPQGPNDETMMETWHGMVA